MLIDAQRNFSDIPVESTLCIIGAGAAGIALAQELIGESFDVCLLESGGLTHEPETQALYRGASVGIPYASLDTCRLRYLGGTTNHWTGACWPLDPGDFESRDWVPYSGWPLSRRQLDPYYERAHVVCDLGPYRYDSAFWGDRGQHPELPLQGSGIVTRIYQRSPPTRFGAKYRDALVKAGNVRLVLHANALEIETDENDRMALRVRIGVLDGRQCSVAARVFVLAAGGIENARLLLLSRARNVNGLGNGRDLVGRFFMDHLAIEWARLLPVRPDLPFGLYRPHAVRGWMGKGTLGFHDEVLRRERLLSGVYSFGGEEDLGPDARPDALSGPNDASADTLPSEFSRHVAEVMDDLEPIPRRDSRSSRRAILLRCQLEQAPNPQSRVTLSTERDALGANRVVLDWRLTDLDRRMIAEGPRVLALALGRAGIGRLHFHAPGWKDERSLGSDGVVLRGLQHHMGTTRMHVDPSRGVVDADCRLHETANVYVAGSSVFPSVGYANPTLTIVALALRLADALKRHLR